MKLKIFCRVVKRRTGNKYREGRGNIIRGEAITSEARQYQILRGAV